MDGAGLLVGRHFAAAPQVSLVTIHPTTTAYQQVLDLNVQADPNRPFISGSAGLAPTVFNPALKANANATVDQSRVMPLMLTEERIGFAAQGSDSTHALSFSNWQYIDRLVTWGGTSERNVTAPGQAWIDAAHRNGVKIYGNVFMAPNVYGGDVNQVEYLVQKGRRGNYVVADRLIEMAQTQKFDGWFINQETNGVSAALAEEVGKFLDYVQSKSDVEVVWYDSMTESGNVGWQGRLNSSNDRFFQNNGQVVSDAMFLDFRNSVGSSNPNAAALGRSPYDLYKGANLEGGGIGGGTANMNAALGNGQQTSIGMYRPENFVWNDYSSNWDVQQMINAEDRLYVGAAGDPSNTAAAVPGTSWHGFADHIAAKSPLTRDRFVSNFNYGLGKEYSINGVIASTQDWSNMGAQDVLPTWRWMVQTSDATPLTADFDFDAAYMGGNSLRVAGSLDNATDLPLFLASSPLFNDSQLTITYKTSRGSSSTMQVYITLEGDEQTRIPFGSLGAWGQWNQVELDLSAYAGQTLSSIGLRFLEGARSSYGVNIGQIGLLRGERDVPLPPPDISLQSTPVQLTSSEYEVRLLWDHSPDYSADPQVNNLYYYNVFQQFANGSREHLGVTGGAGYWINDLRRESGQEFATLIVQAVSLEWGVSESQFLLDWDSLTEITNGPGDFNGDGVVDAADYTVWRDSPSPAQADYLLWRSNYGNIYSPGNAHPATVPTPTGGVLVFIVFTTLCGIRRRPRLQRLAMHGNLGSELRLQSIAHFQADL